MNKKAFTLIELLVGISISTILMLSVGYLVTGGIANITSQKQLLSNTKNLVAFQNKLNQIFSNIDTSFTPVETSSGVILKIKQNYDEGGFVYIGSTGSLVKNNNGIYCLSGSENINTKHVFIKTFIPDFDTNIQKTHKIDGVGRGIFGYNEIPKEGIDQNKVYLNSPTGTTLSGTIEFISDTLNNRILYKSSLKIYELLNREDGISEPTGLYYDNSEKALYIANSGNGEILKYSSKSTSPTPDLTMTGITNIANDNNFVIELYCNTGAKDINSLTSTGNFTFTNYTKQNGDTIVLNNNKLTYNFSGGTNENFNNVKITTSNLSDFSGTGSYYIKFKMGSFEKYYKYFIQSDDSLFTKDDNSLEIHKSGLEYPTKINSNPDNPKDYLNPLPTSNLIFDKKYDYILNTPIKDLDISWNNSDKLLKLSLTYYKKYNCYNLEDKVKNNFIWIKNFK